jgi:hypothetical protein
LLGPGREVARQLGARVILGIDVEPTSRLPTCLALPLVQDAAAAVEYLQEKFGFELRLSEIGGAGRSHNELLLGDDGLVMLGQAGEGFASPRTLGSFPPSRFIPALNGPRVCR